MTPSVWKITCEEDRYPGLWLRWFRAQSVAVGWAPQDGYRLDGRTKGRYGWARARNSLHKISPGDYVVVALQGNRLARLGKVLELAVSDERWDPFVPAGPGLPHGEKGRGIHVKWNLLDCPEDRETVVQLPPGWRLSSGELRPTIAMVNSQSLARITRA